MPAGGDPIVLCAPEGEMVAREMSAFPDVRLVPDFLCVTVPDEIEYPFAHYTSFKKLFNELISGCGWDGVYQVYRIELLLPAEEVVYDEPNVNMIRELLIRDMNRLAQKNFTKNAERSIGNQVYFLSADYKVNQSLIANTFLKPTDKGGTSDAVS